jgi:hypothetical protein
MSNRQRLLAIKRTNMKRITLTISNIDRLNSIQQLLVSQLSISKEDKLFLSTFLSQIPETANLLEDKISFDEKITIGLFNMSLIDCSLKKWQNLFGNLPGWDYCPYCFFVDNDLPGLLQKNIIIVACFAPSFSYNSHRSPDEKPYEVHLKDDGTATFYLPTLNDAKQYPELYNFNGTWKEAYLLLIETLKKGWPMEEFPEELQQFLKK